MNNFIKYYLKKSTRLYSFLRYQHTLFEHKFFSGRRLVNKNSIIDNLLDDINERVVYKKRDYPLGSLIEITNACNLNCLMCGTRMSKRKIGFMTPELFGLILNQLRSVGINSVGLHTVGETFMHKGLSELLAVAERKNFQVWLSTNGQFPLELKELYHRFPNTANTFRISIDGATRETYEKIRKGASFDKLIQTLDLIDGINKGRINSRIVLAIDSIVSMSNIPEIQLFFKIYGRYCWPEYITFNIVNGLSLDKSFFRQEFPFPNLIRWNVPCHMPFQSIYFTYSGKATLCCRDYEEQLIIGDINKSSIREIWNSQEAEIARKKHLNRRSLDIESCKTCYMPYISVSQALDNYIHFLIRYYPELGSEEFKDRILFFLKELDAAIAIKTERQVRDCILKVFLDRDRY